MAQTPALYQACIKATKAFTEATLAGFHDSMTAKLEDLLENSRSNLQQWQLMELQRSLRTNRDVFRQNFLDSLRSSFENFQRGDVKINKSLQDEPESASGLTLVDNDALEQNIAAKTLIQRVGGEFTEPLCLIHERLCVLTGHKLPEEANPVCPTQLAQCFEQALKTMELENQLVILFYKIYEKTLHEHCKDFYAELNKILADGNILPNTTFAEIQRKRAGTNKKPTPPPKPPAAEQEGGNYAESGLDQVLQQEIQQLDPGYQQSGYQQPGQQQNPGHMAPAAQQAQPGSAAAAVPPNPELPSGAYQQQLFSAIQQMQLASGAPSNDVRHGAPSAPVHGGMPPQGMPTQSIPSGQASNVHPISARPEVLGAINQLQSAAVSGGGKNSVFQGNAAVALTQPLTHFAQLTPGNLQACPVQPLETVVQALTESLPDGQQLNSQEVNTLDLVGMIFEFMLKDDELPDSVKSLLSYLHVPYMKVALHDPDLFAQADNPARQLLNKLSEAGSLWLNKEGYGQFKVFDEIKNTVDKILKDFGEGMKLFEDLLNSFEEFVEKVEHRIDQLERLTSQKAEAEERLQKVKAYVHKRIKARVNNEKVPAPIVALLLYPWFDYLTSIMLRYGEKSEQWQQGLQVIDNLLWSIKPKQSEHEIARLKNLRGVLRKQLEKGFEVIGYDQIKADELLDSIDALQSAAIKENAKEIEISEAEQKEIHNMQDQTGIRERVVEPPDLSILNDDEKDLVDKLRLIEFGTWFEFNDDNQAEPQKLKVAWFSKENLSYMFVNSAGKQVSMLSALEIARGMLKRTARIIAGSAKPFFERALESIYHRMAAQSVDSIDA